MLCNAVADVLFSTSLITSDGFLYICSEAEWGHMTNNKMELFPYTSLRKLL